MEKVTMNAVIIFIFANQMLYIFGNVTVLHGVSLSKSDQVKLICISEDDGGALVWNYNLTNTYNYSKENNIQFRNINVSQSNEINCKMNVNEGCLESWTRNDWVLTSSLETSMGPVFDQRWEDFKEYGIYSTSNYVKVDFNLDAAVELSFSVRVSQEAKIFICNGTDYFRDNCYWITIGAWSQSYIHRCTKGMPVILQGFVHKLDCSKLAYSYKHSLLSGSEWRTFVITWDALSQNIILYNTDNIILTYTDRERRSGPHNNYHMFIKNDVRSDLEVMLFRFHIYDFLHTTVENAVLTSPIFQFNSEMICLQMLIGLCAECHAQVVLYNHINNKTLATVKAKGTKAIHGLPMWQFVTIKENSSAIDYNTNSRVVIQVIPKLNKRSLSPLWAIANVRQCPKNGALRIGTITSVRDWYPRDNFESSETCQKLFYNEHAVVDLHLTKINPNISVDDANCSEGKIGPQCLFSCASDLSTYSNCTETKICYKNGCTCASGFFGDGCSLPCDSYKYGYGCKKTCGSCIRNEECNRVTGMCNNGCDNEQDKIIYISPLCQTRVDKPDAPTIISTSETTIRANVSVAWKDEYEKMPILYTFVIQGPLKNNEQSWKELFQNMTQLTEYFENLEHGTIYRIGFSLNIIQGTQINSNWQIAETTCNQVKNFEVTPQEDGMIIDWSMSANQLYSCPKSWYYLKVRNSDTNEIVLSTLATTFPYELTDLTPYTSFNMTVLHNNSVLFSQEILTLEGVPSNVLDLQSMLSANTQLTLSWRPPRQPKGSTVKYTVHLKVAEYVGCKDLNMPTPNNLNITKSTSEPMITIPDLHPYTSYIAQVTAHNSRYSSQIAETKFGTNQSEIPSEIFGPLKVQGWKLSWSPPEDCTTITGLLKARIIIQGISDAVKYFKAIKQTKKYNYDLNNLNPKLNGVERYLATVYVIRDFNKKENASAYQKCEYETPPTAPPRITNLEVVEIDTSQTPAMMHLRWQSPLPPLNGKLRSYGVLLCDINNTFCSHSIIPVQLDESCYLWDNYICKVIQRTTAVFQQIKVFAYNINVTESSELSLVVTDDSLLNITPDKPRNYTFTVNDNSVVDLKWLHPWKTGDHLESFRIRVQEISSNLRTSLSRSVTDKVLTHTVTEYMRNYSERLYLLPATQYFIYIQSVTVANKSSNETFVEVYTPSTAAFDGVLGITVDKSNYTILLNLPSVLNDTRDSTLHIIVKGTNLCEQYSEVPEKLRAKAGVKMNEIAWQAAEVSTNELAGERFRIGDDNVNSNARNCRLKHGESYEIVIIVTEQNSSTEPIMLAARMIRVGEVPLKNYGAWLAPIILFTLLAVACAAFYVYRRRRQKLNEQLMRDEIILSQNIENYEHMSMILNSKEDLATPSDRQLRATTPEVMPIDTENYNEEEKMISLVKVNDFEDYVRQAVQSGLLDKQYETFPRGQTRPWDYGKLPQNKSKNKYGNLIAYDDTRMILTIFPNDSHSDYVNANYITGYKQEKRYIATQGPKPNTVIDFWRMIWQENVLIICMLANVIENGKTKCEQYWPDIGKKKKYGSIIVLNAKHNVFADYCFRTFDVTCGKETRKIEHLHYTAWPDHGVPLYTLSVVTYLKKLLATPPGNGPVIVHCSAGDGRIGIIVLCDICLHRAAAEGLVDVFAETASIRSERANMVDNKQQYLLAHLALVECLLSIPTTLPCNEMLLTRIKELKKQLPVQQQRLQNTAWQDEALRQFTSPPPLSERNRAKNRFPELISDKVSRIYLKRFPASDKDSDYLSAVYIDGVKVQNQYLATQLPMPSTINDFWRMIAEFKVELIVMLQPPDLQDPTCCIMAPASGEFKPIPYLNIIVKEFVELEYYTLQKLLLVDNSEKHSREQFVTILCLTEWKPGRNQPLPPVMTMVTFWQAAEQIARGDGPTVTLCHDGVTGCGLYLALSFLLERMAVERECDVCLAVRAVRRSRPDFVRSLEHLEYLYDAAVMYLENFETYANFS